MLENCKSAQERWGGVSEIIDNWLHGRQQLIRSYVALPGCKVNGELNAKLDQFRDHLVDYLSSGHFEVYEQLMLEGSAFNDGSAEAAQKLLPMIQPSTDLALDFNDQFTEFATPTLAQVREFGQRLSALGEALEERFNLEDRLIEMLHESHREQAEQATGA